MLEANFGNSEDGNHHQCESYRDEDWVVFRCPICLDYERRINPGTGEKTTKNVRPDIHHSGSHIPPQVKAALENVN
jgi:hypothetical protein